MFHEGSKLMQEGCFCACLCMRDEMIFGMTCFYYFYDLTKI